MPKGVDAQGCIDFWGYASDTGSWLLCGWIPWHGGMFPSGSLPVVLVFSGDGSGTASAPRDALAVSTVRPDLFGRGVGLALHLPGSGGDRGTLLSAALALPNGEIVRMNGTAASERMSDRVLIEVLARQAPEHPGEAADRLRAVLGRRGFDGHDTVDRFGDQFAFRIDEAIRCGEAGILLNGWLVTAPPGVRAVRLRCGALSTLLGVADGVRVGRPDVLEKYGKGLGSRSAKCGFILFEPDAIEPGSVPFFEIETIGGEVGYARLSWSLLRGLAAIRHTLANLSPRYSEVERTFNLIGPAIALLNQARLEVPRGFREVTFGAPPANPDCSVIVPLYGRIDYMEVQVAFLSEGSFPAKHELIYVVDDPELADAALHLADSVFRRFRLPLRLMLLDENFGFAPACNAGLSIANGEHVCFLNSDVFAFEPDWLDRLLSRMAAHPSVGLIGPVLLFEDGTIQHQGMRYEPLPEFGNWLFPVHPGKGSRPGEGRQLSFHPAITGACLVMPRRLALELDGFDEHFVVGDFEDSDLCLRAADEGFASAVDHGVTLYHLERQSQGSAADPWRMNLTLYNAWLHQRRWSAWLAARTDAQGGATAEIAIQAAALMAARRAEAPEPATADGAAGRN